MEDSGNDVPPGLDPSALALVAEGCTRSGVIWVRPTASDRHHLAWHAWHDGAVLLVSGGGEQQLPRLEGVVEVVVPSKDSRARLVTVLTRAQVLPPGTLEWAAAVGVLAAKRLNERDPAGQMDRWARAATIIRLEPVRVEHTGAGTDDTLPGVVRPPTAGTTTGRRPWHWRGRPGGRRGTRATEGSTDVLTEGPAGVP
jgi:hypothetical protein